MKKLLSVEKKAKYREGVEARKQERARIKKVKELTKAKQDIPPELRDPIPDPEAIWKAEQAVLQAEQATRDKELEEEDITFVCDTQGDPNLTQGDGFKSQQDYIPLPSGVGWDEHSESDSDTSCSDDYDSENDYSWHGRKA